MTVTLLCKHKNATVMTVALLCKHKNASVMTVGLLCKHKQLQGYTRKTAGTAEKPASQQTLSFISKLRW